MTDWQTDPKALLKADSTGDQCPEADSPWREGRWREGVSLRTS
jgi:hypothetical protein